MDSSLLLHTTLGLEGERPAGKSEGMLNVAFRVAVVAVGMKLLGARISFCEGTAESFLQSGRPSTLGALSLLLFLFGALSLWRRESEKIKL